VTFGQFLKKGKDGESCWCLGFAFFFFAEVGGPLQFTCVPMELEATLFAFAGVKPENGAVVLHVHHACASGKLGAAE
jgi:hypothetical protein